MADNALQKQEAEVADYGGGVLALIDRAVRDPSVDIDKMERLLAMQERVMERQAKQAFTEAKIAMQDELPIITMKGKIVIEKGGQVIQSTPFARFEDIHQAVMPILKKHGFDLKFRNSTQDGKPVVTTILSHVEGHSEDTEFELPMDTSGSKNNVQAVGSSTSYGKRYGTISILNLRVHGEDDDAVEAGKPAMVSDEQRDQLFALSQSVGADIPRLLNYLDIPGKDFRDVPAARFDDVWEALQTKGAKRGTGN